MQNVIIGDLELHPHNVDPTLTTTSSTDPGASHHTQTPLSLAQDTTLILRRSRSILPHTNSTLSKGASLD